MTTIYKYPIRITDRQSLFVPDGATVRHLGLDPNGALCLWAEVDKEAEPVEIQIAVVGTGHPVPSPARHIGSAVQNEFVWHVYDVTPTMKLLSRTMRLLRDLRLLPTVELPAVELAPVSSGPVPTTGYVVCELIAQRPCVSVHPDEASALKHAVDCAMENLWNQDTFEDTARAEFESTLSEFDRICENDYEVHILTPTNQ